MISQEHADSSEEEFFEEFFLPLIWDEAVGSDSEAEDGVATAAHRRVCRPGGAGTIRDNRSLPRPFLPSVNGEPAQRRHFGMASEWGRRFFNPVAPPRPGELAWDIFNENFRIPLPIFNWILACAREDGRFPFEAPPNGGHEPTPMCLKVAAFFRWLAVGSQVNVHCEASGCSRQTLQAFFPVFGDWIVERFYHEWVRFPRSSVEVAILEKPFRKLGVPGAICSQDGVHIAWNRCPSALKPDYVGKEGYPTLAWNCCVAHTTRILSIHGHRRLEVGKWLGPFKGTTNDKTMVRTDPLITAIGEEDIFVDYRYLVFLFFYFCYRG